MKDPFEQKRSKAIKVPRPSDPEGRAILENMIALPMDQAQAKFEEARKERLGTPWQQHEAAYKYLGLGFRGLEDSVVVVDSDGKTVSPAELFHFAGHAFREIGQLNRAADAYFRAGMTSEKGKFRTRSLARAKTCYAEIGQADQSDCMHVLEWHARYAEASCPHKILLSIWRVTTAYGTSLGRWLVSLLVVLFAFSISYELLHYYGAIDQKYPWTAIISAFHFCVVTTATLGNGDISLHGWIAELVVVLNVFLGYGLLILGSTVLGRKILRR